MLASAQADLAEYEKARGAQLRHARERQRKELGKWEGRKSHAEIRPNVVADAKRLRRAGERMSYREISARLAKAGLLNERGQLFNPKSVRAMILG